MQVHRSAFSLPALILAGLAVAPHAVAQVQTGLGGAPYASFNGLGADFVQASATTRTNGSVNPTQVSPFALVMPALPAGAVELRSYASWNYLLDGVSPPTDTIGINGLLVQGTRIGGGMPDLTWGKDEVVSYLADVTGMLVHGGPNDVASACDKVLGLDPAAFGEGITLLSVYTDSTKQPRSVDVWTGYTSTSSAVTGEARADLLLSQPYFSGAAHFFVNALDGQFNAGDEFYLNGTSVGGLITGTVGALNAWRGLAGPLAVSNLYDFAEDDISGWMVVGDTSVRVRSVPVFDTIAHSLAAISLRVDCGGVATYCTAKPNSLGCLPTIRASGFPSATEAVGFEVSCTNARNGKPGLLMYSVSGPDAQPFSGGTLCLATPIRRTPGQNSGGNPAPFNDCSGVLRLDMNTFGRGLLGSNPLPALSVVGTVVHCQWWGRDQGFPAPNNTMLSGGLRYTICP